MSKFLALLYRFRRGGWRNGSDPRCLGNPPEFDDLRLGVLQRAGAADVLHQRQCGDDRLEGF